jgi:hypothetical protein
MHKPAIVREYMKVHPSRRQREACHYILAYLADNPDAGDTLDGIVEWWMLTQTIKFETHTVSQAVAKLVAEGLIVEKRIDSRVIYKVNRT